VKRAAALAWKRTSWPAAALAALALVVWLALVWLGLAPHDSEDVFVESRPPPGLAERFYPPRAWAWGLLQVADAPPQRYGVAAGEDGSRAQLLILPDYGESAETWFETARDLNAAGVTVWVLEGVGQGGSGRLTRRRDLGEAKDFTADVAAVRAMAALVIRPDDARPLILLGEGQGAVLAARAAELGLPAAGVVLSSPRCHGALAGDGTRLLRGIGLGAMRAPGEGGGWRRADPDDYARHRTHDRWRGAVTHAWQWANPDLRMSGPSLDWLAAARELQRQTRANLHRLAVRTLVIAPVGAPACLSPPGARTVAIAGAGSALELEDDARRGPWLASVRGFVAAAAQPSPDSSPAHAR
jgi:lysophospholipase